MPLGSSRNWVIWFRNEPTNRDPRKVVMTCGNVALMKLTKLCCQSRLCVQVHQVAKVG